ncbi:MAG TPA: type II toxin-antitoxin system RelE/ParE family toxin [Streptosporangiaceae bacterium]|nr:type II toxin-antitoxin system RelE/ParE family toxin [Streptosporangiaceae bacterium]
MWVVAYLPEAERERAALPKNERAALINADAKLGAYGPRLGYPHTSAVRGAASLRELRPRAGRSAWRALYRQVGEVFVVAAIGPEAQADPRGFDRAVRRALERLAEVEEG